MKELTVKTENRVGALASVCEALGGVGVNIDGISAYGVEDNGIIRLITADEKTAETALKRAGFSVNVSDILIVTVKDKPGELAKVTRKIAKAGVDVESLYMLRKVVGGAEFAIKANSISEAAKALR